MIEQQVFIIDDDPAVRDALFTLVESVGLRAVCFDSADAFLAACSPRSAGCIVTDVCLPGIDGMTLQTVLAEHGIDMPLIAMSAHGDIAMAVEMVRHGAIDFIEKPFRNHTMLARIREAIVIAEQRHERRLAMVDVETRLNTLTPRERDILPELLDGSSNKHIARRLTLSPRTVEAHRANILHKMRVESVTALAVLMQNYRTESIQHSRDDTT